MRHRFSKLHHPSPVCQPARGAILTGLLPFTNGAADNGIDLDPEIAEAGFAGHLSRAGYQTALVGKAHFSTKATFAPTGRAECATSSADFPSDWNGPYMGFDHVELALFGKWFPERPPLRPPQGQHFERWFFDAVGGDEGFRLWAEKARPATGAHQTWSSALPVAWHPTTWIGDRSVAFLRNRNPNRPFLLGRPLEILITPLTVLNPGPPCMMPSRSNCPAQGTRPRTPAMVASRRARRRSETGRPGPQALQEVGHAGAVPDGRATAPR